VRFFKIFFYRRRKQQAPRSCRSLLVKLLDEQVDGLVGLALGAQRAREGNVVVLAANRLARRIHLGYTELHGTRVPAHKFA